MITEIADRRYQFHWSLLGDMVAGRPNLGPTTRLEIYRLMQFTFRDVLEQSLGAAATDEVFRQAGRLAGAHFYDHYLSEVRTPDELVSRLQSLLRDLGVGVLRIEKADFERGQLVLTVSEDLDCSGLPDLGQEICSYDEGFIAALLEKFTGKAFTVKEIDCWCTGERTSRFTAEALAVPAVK
ncbi:MAG: 4-vinyl reductase [Planctomycetota bacterium]|nr:4-vinyl reductase [Planctomycetota bacterium]